MKNVERFFKSLNNLNLIVPIMQIENLHHKKNTPISEGVILSFLNNLSITKARKHQLRLDHHQRRLLPYRISY